MTAGGKAGLPALATFCMVLAGIAGQCLAETPLPANILVLYSNDRLLPANREVERGFMEQVRDGLATNLHVYSEYLDAPFFAGERYRSLTAEYLGRKYAGRPVHVVVAVGTEALWFMLEHRDAVFHGVPVVYAAVDRSYVAGREFPADVVGTPADYDFARTIDLALELQPRTRRLVVVTGSGEEGEENELAVLAAAAEHSPAVRTEYLRGLATDEVLKRLASLDAGTVVFTPGYYEDGTGRSFTPREAVELMAAASSAPVYTPFDTQLGTGIVGGRMTTFAEMGRATRKIVDQIVSGVPVNELAVPDSLPATSQLDWRQLQRWGIADRRVSSDAIVQFRPPSFWEAYRTEALVLLGALLLQSALIAALLLERRRRRLTSAALEDSERRLHMAASAARLTTFELDLAPGHEEAFRQWLDGVHPADRVRLERTLRDAAEAAQSDFESEFRLRKADGTWQWTALRGHFAATSSRFTGVSMDITQRKAAELQAEADRAALTRVSRIAMAGQLSAGIAHQLNQPLAAILGNAEAARRLLERDAADQQHALREILDDIIGEDHRAAEIIRRLGALYKRGDVQMEELDLNALANETKLLLQTSLTQRRVHLAMHLAEPLPRVRGSRISLQQVLLNLILNAADAMADAPEDQREVIVETASSVADGEVRLSVGDRGPGIPAEHLRRIFEPFWTTKSGGVGVGLAICASIIGAHHGRIWAANDPARGAVFSFTLPASAD